jgi:hypothetical protein
MGITFPQLLLEGQQSIARGGVDREAGSSFFSRPFIDPPFLAFAAIIL